jgi:hypothetical protein
MVTGRTPRRDEPEETIPSPADLPPALAGILPRMLTYRSADRYPHAAALLTDLDRLAGEIGGCAARRRGARLQRSLCAAGMGLMFGLALFGFFAVLRSGFFSGRAGRRTATV